jgi:Fungal cellulose binding domain
MKSHLAASLAAALLVAVHVIAVTPITSYEAFNKEATTIIDFEKLMPEVDGEYITVTDQYIADGVVFSGDVCATELEPGESLYQLDTPYGRALITLCFEPAVLPVVTATFTKPALKVGMIAKSELTVDTRLMLEGFSNGISIGGAVFETATDPELQQRGTFIGFATSEPFDKVTLTSATGAKIDFLVDGFAYELASATAVESGGVCPYEKCNGKNNDGTDFDLKTCTIGYECVRSDDWYSQCRPKPWQPATQGFWQQCAGIGYKGVTACTVGSTCTALHDWYSQCKPDPCP